MPGVIVINEGRIYNPSSEETYTAYFDVTGKGEYKEIVTPVDLGACVSTLTVDMETTLMATASPPFDLRICKSGRR